MPSTLNPYLGFKDDARQAMEFYREVLGGTLEISSYGEYGAGSADETAKVMHARLTTDLGFVLMAADTPDDMPYEPGSAISVSIAGDDADALRGYWAKLSAAGKVIMPMEKQAWGDEFGMCVDQFGVRWMVNISTPSS